MEDNKTKIYYLSQYFPPEMGAPAARVYDLSKRWAANGADVSVITAFPHHPTGIIPPEYRGKYFMTELVDGIRVYRTYIYAAPNKGFFRRTLSYISFMFSSIFRGLRLSKPDILIATSPQFFVAIAGYIISRIKGVPFVLEVRDFWPTSIVELNMLKNKMIIRLLERIELFLYEQAKHIVVVADSYIKVLREKGIPSQKITTVKNGVDLDLFSPRLTQNEIKNDMGLAGKFVVSYIGTHGLAHALDIVLDAAAMLKRQNDNIHFLFIGEGAEKENLIQKAAKLNLTNVTFMDKVNRDALTSYYTLSDILLVPLRKISLFQIVLPSKISEIMAMERPILLSIDGEARKIVEQAQAGIYVEPENPAALQEKILFLYEHTDKKVELGKNGRAFVMQNLNRNVQAVNYLELITKIVKEKNA